MRLPNALIGICLLLLAAAVMLAGCSKTEAEEPSNCTKVAQVPGSIYLYECKVRENRTCYVGYEAGVWCVDEKSSSKR